MKATLQKRARRMLMIATLAAVGLGGCDRGPKAAEKGHAAPAHGEGDGHDHGPAAGGPLALPPIGPGDGYARFIPTAIASPTDWCREHGVPESVCSRCNPALVPLFKERQDWCAGHDRPESQCLLCNPEFAARWAALKPKAVAEADALAKDVASGIRVEARPSSLTPPNDPLCPIDTVVVTFADAGIAAKAGIETELTRPRRLSSATECPGQIGFDETRLAHLTPRISGVVREVVVRAGDAVEAGAPLLVIESAELGEARSQFIAHRETYQLALADHERRTAISAGVGRLLEISTADRPSREAAEQLSEVRAGEAKSRLLASLARMEVARSRFERDRTLNEQGIATRQDFETARSALVEAETEFTVLREEIALADERDLLAADKALRTARAAMQASERRLHILGMTQEQVNALGDADDQGISLYELRSPQAGVVVNLHAVRGEGVEPTESLVTIADLSALWVTLQCGEPDVAGLRLNLPMQFIVDGLPGATVEGRIDWISPQVDPHLRTVQVRASVTNPGGRMRAGMFGLGRIVLRDNTEVLSVSRDALQTDGCCQLVFVRQSDTQFVPRKVATGVTVGNYVEILHGLTLGEPVASRGSFLLKTEILKTNIGAGCCEVEPGR
jgi:RND family efflux transporter MFP subunit